MFTMRNLKLTTLIFSLLCVTVARANGSDAAFRITGEPLCPGKISPMLYGQFVEYLCDLVPAMWAEKLDDESFEGLRNYLKTPIDADDDTKAGRRPVE
jgi:hypothetical protein